MLLLLVDGSNNSQWNLMLKQIFRYVVAIPQPTNYMQFCLCDSFPLQFHCGEMGEVIAICTVQHSS